MNGTIRKMNEPIQTISGGEAIPQLMTITMIYCDLKVWSGIPKKCKNLSFGQERQSNDQRVSDDYSNNYLLEEVYMFERE